jgi:hypothetical protein
MNILYERTKLFMEKQIKSLILKSLEILIITEIKQSLIENFQKFQKENHELHWWSFCYVNLKKQKTGWTDENQRDS